MRSFYYLTKTKPKSEQYRKTKQKSKKCHAISCCVCVCGVVWCAWGNAGACTCVRGMCVVSAQFKTLLTQYARVRFACCLRSLFHCTSLRGPWWHIEPHEFSFILKCMIFSLIHYYELSPSNEQKLINQSLRGVINKRLFDEHNKYSPEQRHNYTHTFTRMRDQNEEREAKLSKLGCFSISSASCHWVKEVDAKFSTYSPSKEIANHTAKQYRWKCYAWPNTWGRRGVFVGIITCWRRWLHHWKSDSM